MQNHRRGRVYKRIRNGRESWSWMVDDPRGPDPETGKRRQVSAHGFETKRAAQEALNEHLQQSARAEWAAPSRITLGEYLESWTAGLALDRRASTVSSYKQLIDSHIIPKLGRARIQELGPERLRAFYADLGGPDGRTDGKGPLSKRTIAYIHTVLRRALQDAVESSLISRNPTDWARPFKATAARPPQVRAYNADQTRAYLAAAAGERLWVALHLAIVSGMRRGEILGTRWSAIDLDAGKLSVQRTHVLINNRLVVSEPKTMAGRRVIALDAGTVGALREWRKRQAAERLMLGLGKDDPDGLVFTDEAGDELHPKRLTDAHSRVAKTAGVPALPFHSLRHTSASLALAAGVPPKVIQERLGHSAIGITLNVYAHTVPSMDAEAAATIANLLT
jgi:integrase